MTQRRKPSVHRLESATQNDSLYGQRQLVLQARVVLVRRQIDPVEARVALGQLRWVALFLDREAARAVRALEVLEPVDGNARRARRELQQTRLPLGWPRAYAFPEPLDHLVVHLVPAVVRKLGPVVTTSFQTRVSTSG